MREARVLSFRVLLLLVLVAALSWVAVVPAGAANPVVNISPSSGPIGTRVTVSACGLVPGNVVIAGNITFGGQPWNTRDVIVDSSGCMCATPSTVPMAAVGPTAVTVHDGNVTAVATFTVTQPNMALSPTSGYKGETVTVTGTGWTTSDFITVTFQGSRIGLLAPDSAGTFRMEFIVPLTAAPSNVIAATDNRGNLGPGLVFALRPPGLSITPLSGPPGTSVQVHGFGFAPFSGVENLAFASFPLSTAGLITNDTGAFVTGFEAPSIVGGGYIVTATVSDVTLDACFTIFEPEVWGPADDGLPFPVETALATVSHELVRVWGYSNGQWRMYDPADPVGSTLTGLVSGRGYWVKVSRDCTLIFRDLSAGWNNIGW